MALANSNRYSGPFIAAASQTNFTVDWVRLGFDIMVLVDGVEKTNYIINDDNSGFEIVFSSGLEVGQKVEIIGDAIIQRDGNFEPFANYRSDDLNRELNELWAVSQELRRDIGRAVKSNYGQDGLLIPDVAGNDNKFLALDVNEEFIFSNGTGTPTSDYGVALVQAATAAAAQAALKITLSDFDALRAQNWDSPPQCVQIYKPNAIGARAFSGGLFALDTDDTENIDDGGTIIIDAKGNRWKRVGMTFIDPRWFGLVGGLADATSIIQAAINAANLWQLPYHHPSFTAIVTQVTIPAALTIEFGGANSIIKQRDNVSGDLVVLPSADVNIISLGGGFDGNQANQSASDTNWLARCPIATNATYNFENVLFKNHINGIGINGDADGATYEKVNINKCKFINGRQSPNDNSLRDIVLGNGTIVSVTNNYHKINFVSVGSIALSYGRCALFIGAISTSYIGENDFICDGNYAENYGYAGSAGLGIWDFYWCGSNAYIGRNKSVGSIYPPIRGKTNARNVNIYKNAIYAPNVNSAAIAINAPQTGNLKDTILISENYINGFVNYTAFGLCYVTGMVSQAAKNVVWKDNIFVGCAGSTLYQWDYLDSPKIIGGSSDGSGFILNAASGNIGKAKIIGGDYKACTASYGLLIENAGVMSGFECDVIDVEIEHNGTSYAIRGNADVFRVLGGKITGTCTNAITTRNVGHLEVKNTKLSASKTLGINIGASSGTNTTGSYDIQGVDAQGATANALLITSAAPTGLCRNENNSWNYAAAIPTNNNLPTGTKVWNTAPTAGGAPGWMKTGATTWKAMSNLAA